MQGQRSVEVNDAKPASLDDLVGNRSVVEQVRVALDAARIDGRRFEHALLVGPPGSERRPSLRRSLRDGHRFRRGLGSECQEPG